MVAVREQWSHFPREHPVIVTTYNFDWSIIESFVALDRGRRDGSIVLADKSCHNEMKPQSPPLPYLGNTYFLCPAHGVKGAFHPKVVLGFDEQDLLCLIGSHNLTRDGTEFNLEITGFLRIPLTKPHLNLIESIAEFLQGLAECIQSDPIPRDEIRNFTGLIQDTGPGKTEYCSNVFIHSFKEPIITQVVDQIPPIKKVTILVPTHSSNPTFIQKAIDLFGRKALFIIDPSRFLVSEEAKKIYDQYEVKRLEVSGHRPLHAKLYVFHTDDGDWTLYGSPNFTEAALFKSVKEGGNVEAACLIPPSQSWNWEQLFKNSVGLSVTEWKDLQFYEPLEEPQVGKLLLVEKWGYEDADGKAVIYSPGLPDGTLVRVRLYGLEIMIEVKVTNGRLVFDIPSNWCGATRYEVFDNQGNLLAVGDLNRTGAAIPKLETYELDEAARRRLWYYARRLHKPKPKWLSWRNEREELSDILIDPRLWKLGQGSVAWSPVSRRIEAVNPENFYSEAKKSFQEVMATYHKVRVKPNLTDPFLRHALVALDLLIEGVFYAGLYAKNRRESLVYLAKDLSEWMNLPSGNPNQPLAPLELQSWRPHLCETLTEPMVQKWKEYGPRLSLDIGILFDYWIYFQLQGPHCFDSRSLDAVIVTNKYHQIWVGLRYLAGEKLVNAAVERVFDSRADVLSSHQEYKMPFNSADLERCLKSAFDKCKHRLQK